MGRFQLSGDGSSGELAIGSQRLLVPESVLQARPELRSRDGGDVVVGIRPESLEDGRLGRATEGRSLSVHVELLEGLGSEVVAHARLEGRPPPVAGQLEELGRGTDVALLARLDPRTTVRKGSDAVLAVEVEALHVFDPQSGRSITG